MYVCVVILQASRWPSPPMLMQYGDNALAKLREHYYTIAVLDLMMPKMNGFEVIEHSSQMSRRPAVVVATAMTGTYIRNLDD